MYEDLLLFGGFPSPYSRRSEQYLNIWHQERVEKLIREDLRDLSHIPDLGRLEMLAALLRGTRWKLTEFGRTSRRS